MNTLMPKFLLRQSLIYAADWARKRNGGYQEFVNDLKRKNRKPNKAMLDGIQFENMVNAAARGTEIDQAHKWHLPVSEMSRIIKGAQQQVMLYRDIRVDGVNFVIRGTLDYLMAGRIYDCKMSKGYRVGQYLESPQTPFYFYLVPEAYKFTYLVSDGKYLYQESYAPDDVLTAEQVIRQFMGFLDRHNLVDIYAKYWRIND